MENSKIVKIKIPNSKYLFLCEKISKDTWNTYTYDPTTNEKYLCNKDIKTSTLVMLSSVGCKTPFPYKKQ